MDSFFSNLRSHASFHQIDSDSEENENSLNTDQVNQNGHIPFFSSCSQNEDVEVDDFLLVEADPTTVNHELSISSLKYPDSPPTYKQVSESDELPSYQSVLSGSCIIVSGSSEFSEVFSSLASKEDYLCDNKYSSVSDVPFQLHPALQTQQKINEILVRVDRKPFDWFNYSYDFNKERLWLRDFISDEVTNINELIAPLSISQSCDGEQLRESEINAMQL